MNRQPNKRELLLFWKSEIRRFKKMKEDGVKLIPKDKCPFVPETEIDNEVDINLIIMSYEAMVKRAEEDFNKLN